MLFNATYILVFDGTNGEGNKEYVYWILDWNNNPGLAVGLLFGVVIGFPLIFCLYYLLAMLRDYFWKRICKSDFDDIQNSTLYNVTTTEDRFREQIVP